MTVALRQAQGPRGVAKGPRGVAKGPRGIAQGPRGVAQGPLWRLPFKNLTPAKEESFYFTSQFLSFKRCSLTFRTEKP